MVPTRFTVAKLTGQRLFFCLVTLLDQGRAGTKYWLVVQAVTDGDFVDLRGTSNFRQMPEGAASQLRLTR